MTKYHSSELTMNGYLDLTHIDYFGAPPMRRHDGAFGRRKRRRGYGGLNLYSRMRDDHRPQPKKRADELKFEIFRHG